LSDADTAIRGDTPATSQAVGSAHCANNNAGYEPALSCLTRLH
jgi:hypothetical protein